jgi:hypothetical protein
VARIINAYDKARKKEIGAGSPSGGRRPRPETTAITPEETEQPPI